MKKIIFCLWAAAVCLLLPGCASTSKRATSMNAWHTVHANIESYNELTMDLDTEPVEYTIDISTPEGKLKLNKISLEAAHELALVECVMHNKCATLFNPQYTQLVRGGKILRVTVYGYPARYKHKK